MKRFKNILFIAGNGEKKQEALERCAELALRNTAKLTVIGVVNVSTLGALIDRKTLALDDLQQRAISERSAEIEDALQNLGIEGLDITSKILLDGGFVEIIQEVLSNDHDLVIKAAESWSAMNTTWFGSSDLHLMRKCPCPVWIIKPTRTHRYERILAAVDTDPSDSQQDGLNRLIMDLATSLARSEESELHVVHAWDLHGDDWRIARVVLTDQQIGSIRLDVRDRHQVTFDKLLAEYDLGGIRTRTHLIEGRAGIVIPEQAKQHDAGLIVMGTVARTGVPGFFIGNTAENVLNQVNCSVLTVKPQGFVTPVRLES